ncbi:hypothetical protein ACIQ62_03315 [Streptomyces sp. NPDC096319]|uniref:hypothetical protein n=1 Tax=Streptomyces sp. NPDC096319 TaxID=3366084 RepID=UPI0038104D08
MGTSLPRALSAALPVSLAAVLLTGCGGSSAGTAGEGPGIPAAVEIPRLTTTVTEPVPVEAYLLSEAQWNRLGKAEYALRARCMKRFGFPYEDPMLVADPSGQTISQYRYGKLDPAKTAVHGYRTPAPASSEAGTRASKDRIRKISANERMILTGTADLTAKSGKGGQNIKGQTVPEGGCVGEARKRLGDYGDARIADDVNLDSFGKSLQDQRVLAAFAKWSRCMAESGYHYRTPIEASDDKRWMTGAVSPEERTVATADARCKIANNVTGVWYAVDVAYQKQAIEAHAEELAQVRRDIEGQLRTAAEVLGG